MTDKVEETPLVQAFGRGRRCGARSKRTGFPCKQPAMRNGRCRLHGGFSRGPRSKSGIESIKRAKTTHGFYTVESQEEFREAKKLFSAYQNLLMEIE